MKYYRLLDDINYPNRWYLGDLSNEDNWVFSYGKSVVLEESLYLDVYQEGRELDYTLTEGYGVPIVSEELKERIEIFGGLDFIPVSIKGDQGKKYYVMVVTNLVDAVDESKSEFEKFKGDDGIRPDKAGHFRSFYKLAVDPAKTQDFRIFRLARFDTAIIVGEEVKQKLDAGNLKGFIFQPV